MIKKITQSFIKDMREYLAPGSDMCGHLIRHKWIDEKLIEGNEEMKLGAYFEYGVSGALPKDKKVPLPQYMQSGKDKLAQYRRADNNIRRTKKYLEDLGIEIIRAGAPLTRGRYQGTIDIICRCTKNLTFENGRTLKKGEEIIIDLKYSGMLDERWSKHGWVWTDEQREYHGTQAIQYHFVGRRRFFFLVCSSKNETDIKFFEVEVSDQAIDRHISEGNDLYGQLEMIELQGSFTPRPSVSKCLECPLRETCIDRHDYPHPQLITL